MLVLVRSDDGSQFEFESLGSGKWVARFQDGLTKQTTSTEFDITQYPNIGRTIVANQQLAEDLRLGSPGSTATRT